MMFNKSDNIYNSLLQKLIFTPLKIHLKYNQVKIKNNKLDSNLKTTLSLRCGKRKEKHTTLQQTEKHATTLHYLFVVANGSKSHNPQ